MTKLIGGNISDTPIKNIGDGSAFSAGGGTTDAATTFLATLGATDNLEAAWLPGYLLSYQTGKGRLYGNAVVSPASGAYANHYEMVLGENLADLNPPSYTGTPGDASSGEYLGFDGSAIFRLAATPTTFLQSLAKDNAAFSFLIAYYHATGVAASQHLFGTQNAASRDGIQLRINDIGWNTPELFVWNASGIAVSKTHTGGALAAGWHIIGISVDEATAAGHFIVDGSTDSFTSTYTSPTTNNPTTLSIGGANGVASNSPLNTGTRVGDVIMWNAAIGSTALTAASAVLETKYGV